MSVLSAFFEGWGFRTSHPVFEEGDEISAVVTDYDEEQDLGVVRIGDTVLSAREVAPGDVDSEIRLRITEFQRDDHTGRAERIE